MQSEKHFVGYLHSFRGFAILNILAIHAFVFSLLAAQNFSWNKTGFITIINETLFHDSTIYFAVISGILFSTVLKQKGYIQFFKSKIFNVFLPYLFFTLFFSLFKLGEMDNGFVLRQNWQEYPIDILSRLIVGTAQFTYWYIPVLFFLFVMTPILSFICDRKKMGPSALVLISIAPLFISRSAWSDPSLSTPIYFLGSYALGIFLGQNLEENLNWMLARTKLLLAIALFTSILVAFFQWAQIEKITIVSVQESTYYLQKLALSALFLLWLRQKGDRQPKWMAPFANSAFSIYFLHAAFMWTLTYYLTPLISQNGIYPFNILGGGIVLFVSSLLLSQMLVLLSRKAFGKYSRMLIGS